ncbi:DUF1758 domain-containing protein [Trichonephila clavipes]|uniref:DUF1758 domain-containing protein n=1 Tax=Trichonephila clavipes TaxID=2585209 RepID=A0A8X7BLC2_TRICX|nr:DUF1758 domain-containing protein [Trichonephila clavipes]
MRARRNYKTKPSGSGEKAKTTWPYYEIMKFLGPCLESRSTSGNVTFEIADVFYADHFGNMHDMMQENGLQKILKIIRSWKLPGGVGLGIRDDPVLHESDQSIEIFKETVEFDKGRYIVQFPFRKSYKELSYNYHLAKQRFQNLWRRFGHDSELYQQYREIIRDYTEQGIIEEVKTEITHTHR